MCSPALVIRRGSDSALVAALMIQDLASMKTYENYEILWILRQDCYVNEQKIFPFWLFFFSCSGLAHKKTTKAGKDTFLLQ